MSSFSIPNTESSQILQTNLRNSDVNTLINHFKTVSGFQRSNRFRIDIDPPNGVPSVFLFASNVQIPSQTINYYQDTVSPSGAYVDIPVKREYDDRFIIDFIVDKNWNTRQFFDNWMNLMFDSRSGSQNSYKVKYRDNIVGKVDIYALDINNNVNKRITLVDAWPSTLLPTQMMNDNPNDYLTLTVDMNYRYYTTS